MVRANKKILPFYGERRGLRFLAITAVIAILVVATVFWWLKLTGITMSNEAFCGLTEHQHSEECIHKKLICTLSTEPAQALVCAETEHVHSDTCYEDTCVLNCDIDHDHTDECYITEKVLVCSAGEHLHSEVCYENLPAHEHVDACYEVEYLCGKEEHIHTVSCFSNLEADLETRADWEATLPGRTGDWRRDIVSIASSQVGYMESERNFILAEDGTTRMGYTRYGAWAGNPYGDWSAMFASFCLYYAGIPGGYAPQNTGVEAMYMLWQNSPYYRNSGTYIPQTGDLVFFGSYSAKQIGIITNAGTVLEAVAGDVSGRVFAVSYPADDAFILGYGSINDIWNDNMPTRESSESESEADVQKDESSASEQRSKAEDAGKLPNRYDRAYNNAAPVDLTPYLSTTEFSLFYRYFWETDWTPVNAGDDVPADAQFRLEINYESLPIADVLNAGREVFYTLPRIFQYVESEGNIVDGPNIAGTLSASGNTVTITFREEWLLEQQKNSNVIRGDFYAEAYINLSEIPEEGETELKIGGASIIVDFGQDVYAQSAYVVMAKMVEPQMIEDSTGAYLEYMIQIAAPDGCPDVSIVDHFTNRDYVEYYVGVTGTETQTAASGTEKPVESSDNPDFEQGTVQLNEDGDMVWRAGNLAPEEVRILTYRVKVSDSYVGIVQNDTIQNTATLYAKEYEREYDSANYKPKIGAEVGKTSETVQNSDGSYTIKYSVVVTANGDNAYTLKNVKLVDSLAGTNAAYLPYLSYVQDSFKIGEESVSPSIGTGMPSFNLIIGNLAPGESKTFTYNVKLSKEAFVLGSSDITVKNTIAAYDSSTASGGQGNRLASADNTENISSKVWSRKVASEPITNEQPIGMTPGSRWYRVTGSGVSPDPTPPDSFSVPAGSFRYQVVVNETGDWNASSLEMRDSITGGYLKLTGWLRMDVFNTATNPPSGDDTQVINALSSLQAEETVWVNVEDLTSFAFSPENLVLPNGEYAYLLTYYAKPVNTESISSAEIRNDFSISGEVIRDGETLNISGITVSQSVTVIGGSHFSVQKYAWYYDKNDSTFTNGALYWYIKVDGNIIPYGTVFQDSTNFNGSNNYVDPTRSWAGFFYGSLPDGETLGARFSSMQELLADSNFSPVSEADYTITAENLRNNQQDCDLTVTMESEIALVAGQSLFIVVKTNPTRVPANDRETVQYGNKENYKLPTESWKSNHSFAYQSVSGNEGISKYPGGIYNVDRFDRITQVNMQGSSTTTGDFSLSCLRQVHPDSSLAGTYADWLVSVNQNGALNGQTVTVEDLIPAGMELAYVKTYQVNDGLRNYTVQSNSWGGDWREYHHSTYCRGVSGDSMQTWYYVKGSQVQWKIENLQGEIIFQIVCRVTDKDAILSGQAYPFNNRVNLYGTNGEEIDRSESEIDITKRTLSKQGNYVAELNGGIYPFVVTMNELGEDLLAGSDTLTIIDEMSPTLSLIASSIQVLRSDTLQPVGFSYAVEGQRVEITVPDSLPLTVRYSASVNASPGTKIDLYNSVHWQGYAVAEGGSVQVKEFSYSAGGTAGGDRSPVVNIIKLDANFGTRLGGASFLLEEGSWQNGAFIGNGETKTVMTDSNGSIRVESLSTGKLLSYNTVYRIEEISAPAGYLLNSEPHYFMILRQQGGVWPTVPEGVTPWYNGYEYTFEAFNRGGELYIRKAFWDAGGGVRTPISGTYIFGVYDRSSPTAADEPVRKGSITYTAAGEAIPDAGYLHIVGLDLTKTYYVYEMTDLGIPILPSDGERHNAAGKPFFVHYSSGDNPVSAGGNLVSFDSNGSAEVSVVNQIATQLLPSTGAGGTLLYAFCGLAIFLGGCFMLWCVVRRRRKEET